jgi:hypothetical protein
MLMFAHPFDRASFRCRRFTGGLKEETFINIYQLMHHHLVILIYPVRLCWGRSNILWAIIAINVCLRFVSFSTSILSGDLFRNSESSSAPSSYPPPSPA